MIVLLIEVVGARDLHLLIVVVIPVRLPHNPLASGDTLPVPVPDGYMTKIVELDPLDIAVEAALPKEFVVRLLLPSADIATDQTILGLLTEDLPERHSEIVLQTIVHTDATLPKNPFGLQEDHLLAGIHIPLPVLQTMPIERHV